MKCTEPGSSLTADVTIHGSDTTCDEYGPWTDKDGNLCCWISVTTGEEIKVHSTVSGVLTEGHIDLIVDGIMRHTKIFRCNTGKPTKRNEKFLNAHRKHGIDINMCNMRVKDLTGSRQVQPPSSQAVGTIEVRIAVDHGQGNGHKIDDVKNFEDVDSWRDANVTTGDPEIAPTYEMEFVDIQDPVLKPHARKTLRSQLRKERPGSRPWATFRFFYRPENALVSYGLDKANNTTFTLPVSSNSSASVSTTGKVPSIPGSGSFALPKAAASQYLGTEEPISQRSSLTLTPSRESTVSRKSSTTFTPNIRPPSSPSPRYSLPWSATGSPLESSPESKILLLETGGPPPATSATSIEQETRHSTPILADLQRALDKKMDNSECTEHGKEYLNSTSNTDVKTAGAGIQNGDEHQGAVGAAMVKSIYGKDSQRSRFSNLTWTPVSVEPSKQNGRIISNEPNDNTGKDINMAKESVADDKNVTATTETLVVEEAVNIEKKDQKVNGSHDTVTSTVEKLPSPRIDASATSTLRHQNGPVTLDHTVLADAVDHTPGKRTSVYDEQHDASTMSNATSSGAWRHHSPVLPDTSSTPTPKRQKMDAEREVMEHLLQEQTRKAAESRARKMEMRKKAHEAEELRKAALTRRIEALRAEQEEDDRLAAEAAEEAAEASRAMAAYGS